MRQNHAICNCLTRASDCLGKFFYMRHNNFTIATLLDDEKYLKEDKIVLQFFHVLVIDSLTHLTQKFIS